VLIFLLLSTREPPNAEVYGDRGYGKEELHNR
jgi:hypothetical protein